MAECPHEGFHSGEARYDGATRTLRYVVICEDCRSVVRVLTAQRYEPSFDPHGNERSLAQVA